MEITFRAKTEIPTSPGVYYGRFNSEKIDPYPILVERCGTGVLVARLFGSYSYYWPLDFHWFGPILECKEG